MHPRFASLVALAAIAVPLAAQSRPVPTTAAPQSSHTSGASAEPPVPPPAWEAAARAQHEELIRLNGPGTDAALRNQLLAMGEKDQAARGFAGGEQVSRMTPDLMAKLPATDAELTRELKQIVQEKGWPTIALVGIKASNAAMLILIHTADHAWQRQLLPQLEQLADANKIDPSNAATLIDKELVSEGKLQRYGTQFKVVNGEMAMYGVEDPAGLDQQRAKAMLPPMKFYKQTLEHIYHLKASNAIVSATPAHK